MADRYEKILGNGKAKVRREITETLGGPNYSSVRITVSVEITCNQDESTIQEASQMLHQELIILLEEDVGASYEKLLDAVDTAVSLNNGRR